MHYSKPLPQGLPAKRHHPLYSNDSLSISHREESSVFELDQPIKASVSYKPLVALNIDIGEDSPIKIFIYDFTDPWKRAYEFIQSYDLPEEMHEEIALLISNAKEAKVKELKMKKLSREKPKGSFKLQPGTQMSRRNSCDMRQSNSSVRQHSSQRQQKEAQAPPQLTERSSGSRPVSFERNNSSDCLVKHPRPQDSSKIRLIFERENLQKNPAHSRDTGDKEKSNLLDSTTLLSSTSDKLKLRVADSDSPFDSGMLESADSEPSHPRLCVLKAAADGGEASFEARLASRGDKQDISLLASWQKQPANDKLLKAPNLETQEGANESSCCSPKSGGRVDQKTEDLIREYFTRIDIDGTGEVRSFDVLLSNLPSKVNNELHEILSQHDTNTEEGFKTYTYEMFRAAVLTSPKLLSMRINN